MNAANTLRSAALASIQLPIDRQSGRRPGCPLDALVTLDNWWEWHPIAETITGFPIHTGGPGDRAARVRAT